MDIVTYALCKKIAKAAVSGIKNITINGTDLVIETNDGVKLTMHFPTPKDGVSIVNVEIDKNKHLICTMSDGSTIDAGEIEGIGGGLVQKNNINQFPAKGELDTLYLARDTENLYFWNGTKYVPISGNDVQILAKLETASIEFDNVSDTFDLPVDDVDLNVYVNGMYFTEDVDYTIDRTVSPNQITFLDIYEDWETCTLTYLKPVASGGDVDLDYATKPDIDELFKDLPSIGDIEGSDGLDYATKDDIEDLFKGGETDGN